MSAFATLACAAPTSALVGDTVVQPNVLLIVADDLGVDMLELYGLGSDLPSTPTIDSLAADGVTFDFAYASPTCTPTRANIQTGRYNFRTSLGSGLQPWETASLPDDEITLPQIMKLSPGGAYGTAAFGKWHLTTNFTGGPTAPNDAGYDHFDGSLYNLYQDGSQDYFKWKRITNGVTSNSNTYATSAMVNVTRNWINAAPEPWFVYLPFHAPHSPYHAPPSHLHNVDVSAGDPDLNPRPLYKAMVEAMDKEIGRLFASVSPDVLARTTVIFIGDNGTPGGTTVPPFDNEHAKGTAFEGGVRVPLIVSGANVAAKGRHTSALAHAVDLFSTVADLADVDITTAVPGKTIDGVSLEPILSDPNAPPPRTDVFSQLAYPNTGTDATYCNLDLGFAAQQDFLLSVCGPHLYPGSDPATLTISGVAPFAPVIVVPSLLYAPSTGVGGGTIAPGAPWLGLLTVFADPSGEFSTSIPGEIPPFVSPYSMFIQAIVQIPNLQWKLTNAVAVAFEDSPFTRTMVRGAHYKLIRRTSVTAGVEVTTDSLYDLAVDPFELNDLLEFGPLSLTAQEAAAYANLEAQLASLLAST